MQPPPTDFDGQIEALQQQEQAEAERLFVAEQELRRARTALEGAEAVGGRIVLQKTRAAADVYQLRIQAISISDQLLMIHQKYAAEEAMYNQQYLELLNIHRRMAHTSVALRQEDNVLQVSAVNDAPH